MTATMTPPWPLESSDGDWWALDGMLTRHEAALDLHHSWLDWWVADQVGCDDDDQPVGWVAALRAFLTNLGRGYLRPYDPTIDTDEGEGGEGGWWFECNQDHPRAVPAWIWKDR